MVSATYPNYYAVLGVSPEADLRAIRVSYRRAMRDACKHPDLGGSHAEAALLGEAYAVLRDPQRRLAYDRVFLRVCAQEPASPPGAGAAAPPQHERRAYARIPYHGMILFPSRTHPGVSGQCRELSTDGCSFRTLRKLRTGDTLTLIFQDDPGMSLVGEVRWHRCIPQRFGPPLYDGGVRFHSHDAQRFASFLVRVALPNI